MPSVSRTLGVRALGVDLAVRCTGARAESAYHELARRWVLCATDLAAEPEDAFDVVLDETADDAGLATFLVSVTHTITHRAITANIGRLLMFHAAGICNPATGATVVFVAPGGTGKTTLCRELAPGRGYVSDETIGVAEDGTIVPYPKPLSVRRGDAEAKAEIAPTALGLDPLAVTPYVEAVVLLSRDDGGPQLPAVETLDPMHAITHLAPETSSLDRLHRPLHRLHDLLAGLSLLARVHYREALTLEPMVARLIGPPGAAAGTP